MALTTAQYSTALADILAQFHAGTITEAEFDTAHVALLDQWVISNTDLATRVVDLVTRLDALVVEGEPDAGVGNIGSIAIDLDNQLLYGPKTSSGWGSSRSLSGADGEDGADGQEVSLQKTATHIQWRLGDGTWTNLVALTEIKGDQGNPGSDGADGASVLSGSGAPSSGTGVDGDTYLDVDTGDIYGPKAEGAWGSASGNVKGPKGDKGDTGAEILSGSGAPSAGTGVDGDTYLDTATGDIYGPKTSGAWGSAVANIKGPKGDKGWSPRLAIATDGARRVHQVVDWVGGEGTKPATGQYVGAAGLVATIGDAVDVRGPKGDKGDTGDKAWSPQFALASDGSRRVLQVSGWTGGDGDAPATGQYVGAAGYVADIADAIDVRGLPGTGFVPAGAWAGATSYDTGEAVSHNGASYASRVDANVGIEPGVTAGWETSWMVIADPAAAIGISDIDGLQAALNDRYTKSEVDALLSGKLDASAGPYVYQGGWNAATNTPAIPAAASGNKGHVYKVTVAGSTDIDGTTDWQPGDQLVSNGASWDKIDNSEPDVISQTDAETGTAEDPRIVTALRLRQAADAAIDAATGTSEGKLLALGAGGKVDAARLPDAIGSGMTGEHLTGDVTLVAGESVTIDGQGGLAQATLPSLTAGDPFVVHSYDGFVELVPGEGVTFTGFDLGGNPLVRPRQTTWFQAVSSSEVSILFESEGLGALALSTVTGAFDVPDVTLVNVDYLVTGSPVTGALDVPAVTAAAVDYLVSSTATGAFDVPDVTAVNVSYGVSSAAAGAMDVPAVTMATVAYPLTADAVEGALDVPAVTAVNVGYFVSSGVTGAFRVPEATPLAAETAALVDAMSTAPPDPALVAIDTAIRALIDAGIWSKLDRFWWPLQDSQASCLNWLDPSNSGTELIPVNSPTLTAYTSWAGDGSTSYLRTQFTSGPNFQTADATAAVMIKSPGVGSNRDALGANSGSGITIIRVSDTDVDAMINNSSSDWLASTAGTADELLAMSRTSGPASQLYRGGVPDAANTQAAGAPGIEHYLLSRNNSDAATAFSNGEIAGALFGANLTATEHGDLNSILQTLRTNLEAI